MDGAGVGHVMRPAYVTTAAVRGGFEDLESLIEAFRSSGIPAIELGWAPRPRAGDVTNTIASYAGTAFLVHNYFPAPVEPFVLNLASADETVRQRSLEMATTNLRMSARIGAPFYSVHAGFSANFHPESLGHALEREAVVPRADAEATFRRSILSLASLASKLGVDLLIEPNVVDRRNLVDGRNTLLLFAEAGEIVEFLRAIDHPRVGLLLDVGHLNVSAQTLGFDREEFVDAVAPWVRGLHIHENDGNADQHRPLEAGSWALCLTRDPRFVACPVVLESVFGSVAEAAEHRAWFDGTRGLSN